MSEITPQEVKTLRRGFDIAVIKMMVNDFRRSFHLHPFERQKADLLAYFQNKQIPISLFDERYKALSWPDYQEILPWIQIKEKYLKDFFDCDNQAFLYSSIMAYLFKINTFGTIRVPGHLCNLILTGGPIELKLVMYDPVFKRYKEYRNDLEMDGLKYFPITWGFYF